MSRYGACTNKLKKSLIIKINFFSKRFLTFAQRRTWFALKLKNKPLMQKTSAE